MSVIVWEFSDIVPYTNHIDVSGEIAISYRYYDVILDLLFYKDFENIKLNYYNKDDTKLGYDVYIRYSKYVADGLTDVDYIKIEYITDYMIQDSEVVCEYDIDSTCATFVEMVRYPQYESNSDILKNRILRSEKIRSNAGHVLDSFFVYLAEENDKLLQFKKDSNDSDPSDILDFEKNPEYVNGGFYYDKIRMNDFICSFDQENIYEKSLSLYKNTVIRDGIYNEKINDLINKWYVNQEYNSLVVSDAIKYDGILTFFNTIISPKGNVKFIWQGIEIINICTKEYIKITNSYSYVNVFTVKNIITGEFTEIDFTYYQNSDGELDYESHGNLNSSQVISNTVFKFDNINANYFKILVYINYFNSVDSNFTKFYNNISKVVPEIYIDCMLKIINSNTNYIAEMLDICANICNIFSHEIFMIYNNSFMDDMDFLINYITNYIDNIGIGDLYSYIEVNKLIQIFIPVNKILTILDLSYDYASPEWLSLYNRYNKHIELAIQSIKTSRYLYEIHPENPLTSEFLEAASLYDVEILAKVVSWDEYESYTKTVADLNRYRVLMMIEIISKISYIETILSIHTIYNTLNLYALYRYQLIYNIGVSGCGSRQVRILSNNSMNIMNSFNLLINKIASIEDVNERSKYEKTIIIMNAVAGGVHSVQIDYDAQINYLAFFLLNADKYEIEVLDKLKEFVDTVKATPYPSVCGIDFNNTIDNAIVLNIMPLMWATTLTIEHMDELLQKIKIFEQDFVDTVTYASVLSDIINYIGSI